MSDKKFDIEHLATKEKMKKIIAKYPGCKLLVSCIANYCYLPESINRGKRDKTIYEATNLTIPIAEVETKFSFTEQDDFNWIFLNYDKLKQSTLEKIIMSIWITDTKYLRKNFLSL